MNSLSICMFSNLYPPVVSGSSTQTSALSRELAHRGHRVSVITAHVDSNSPEYEQISGVSIYRIPALKLPKLDISLNFPWLNYTFTPSNIQRIDDIITLHNPDVLHLHNHMFDLGFSAVMIRKRYHKPLVTTLHTVIRHSNNLYNLALYPADRIFLKQLIIKNSDLLVCPDVNVKEYAKEAFRRTDSTIIPYGIDIHQAPRTEQIQSLKKAFGLEAKRVILSLGHVHDIRNRHDLISAMPDVLKEIPNAILLVVGSVSTSTPAQLARRLGIEHAVVFTGPVPHQKISGLLALADLEAHWLNQEKPERTSLGVASLEAMAAGKVVLSAANPDTYGKNLLRDEENMIIVEPEDPAQLARKIIELLDNKPRRKEIGRQAKKTIQEHFSWDSICEQTLRAYNQVIREYNL